MIEYDIHFTDKHITIVTKNKNSSIYLIMMIIMSITLILPLVTLFIYLKNGYALHLGLFIIMGLFGLIAYYFYRLATWNKFGKEHFYIQNKQFIYLPEAKSISFSKIVFSLAELNIQFSNLGDDKSNVFILKDDQITVNTKIKLMASDAKTITEEINHWIHSNHTQTT